jgi:DNA polymerase-3 subunit alpha
MHHTNFVHLHLHTQYSLLDGAIRPAALLDTVLEYKMPAVAVTDHGNLFGAIDFYQKAMKKGVKPIIGCEAYVAPGKMTDRTPPARGAFSEASNYHLILLVKNTKGYQNLCKLLSQAYLDGFYYKPRVDKDLLAECNEGLIALSACLHGEVAHNLSLGRTGAAEKAALRYKEIFTDRRFYLEIQHNGIEEQERVNKGVIELGRKLDIPLVATNDCHYLKKEDARIHDILLCIQTGTTVDAKNRMRFSTDEFYLKSPEEMARAFADTPEAIENTIEIAERCNVELTLDEPHLPEFPLAPGMTIDEMVEEKAKAGLEERLASMAAHGTELDSIKWEYFERLGKELKVIEGMGFSGYFLIVADFIEYARSMDIPVGPGRGSAAGSLVAYALGITNLDPIKYNLLFERFLNPDRVSLPDIDIDFCFEGRDEVIRYVTEKYGPENVTQIITFGQMRARAVIRDVGRALDMPYGDVDRIAKLIPAELNITIDSALEKEPKLKKLAEEDAKVGELIEVARALEGLPRHASTHAAGVVISNKPLVEYLPLYMGTKDNIVTTQYSMKDVEKIGLVKFDFLGLKTLTVIDKTLKLVKANRGAVVDIDAAPTDDPKTYELIASSNTNGIFQLESSGMKDLLRKLKPESIEDLIAAVALHRPGPLQSGMVDDFMRRKHKRASIKYEIPELKDILENTYGVIVYQEQVMEIAKVLACFTPGDADVLRKAMGKKLPEEMVIQRSKFLDGSRQKNIRKDKAEKIFDLMAKFAGYGFNKSHSAAYALIAFQTAYLKAHYPVEFMAALLSSDMDNTDQVVKYINECREMGIEVTPPDLNSSSKRFTVTGEMIRFGLAAVKNVGSSAIDDILAEREEGAFTDLLDFLVRIDSRKVNKKVAESLIRAGAFDFTGLSGPKRGALLSSLPSAMEAAQKVQRDREIGQGSIFEMLDDRPADASLAISVKIPGAGVLPEPAACDDWTEAELLSAEKETLGFYFSSHPLLSYKKELKAYTTAAVEELGGRANNETVTVGGMKTALREVTTKKGARMAFLTLEGLSGAVEVVVFPELYKNASEALAGDSPLLVIGRLEKDEESVKIIAGEIALLEDASQVADKIKARNTHILAQSDGLSEDKLERLKEILRRHPGSSPVFLHLIYPDDREVVMSLPDEFKVSPLDETFSEIKGLSGGIEVRVL